MFDLVNPRLGYGEPCRIKIFMLHIRIVCWLFNRTINIFWFSIASGFLYIAGFFTVHSSEMKNIPNGMELAVREIPIYGPSVVFKKTLKAASYVDSQRMFP
jgi:hypothetical protein